jgi:hypothetical protein
MDWATHFSLSARDYSVPPPLLRLPPVIAQLTHSLSNTFTVISAIQTLHTASIYDPYYHITQTPTQTQNSVPEKYPTRTPAPPQAPYDADLSVIRIHLVGATAKDFITAGQSAEEVRQL